MLGRSLNRVLLPAQERRIADTNLLKNALLLAQECIAAHGDESPHSRPTLPRNSFSTHTSARSLPSPVAKLQHVPIADLWLGRRHTSLRAERNVCCKVFQANAAQIEKVSLCICVPPSAKLTALLQPVIQNT